MLRISPSKVPIYIKCGMAAHAELPISDSNEAAEMGSACHAVLAQLVRDGEHDPIWRWAEQYGVDDHELGWLVAYGRTCWNELQKAFPSPMAEKRLEAELAPGIILSGTADVLSMTGRGCAVLDWKTSRARSDLWPQLASYALLATEALGVEECAVVIPWLRHYEYDSRVMAKMELQDFKYRLVRSVCSQTYQAGEHCQYCPRRYECPALQRKLSASVGQLKATSAEETLQAAIDAGKLPDLLETVKAVERACSDVREGIRRRIESDGPFVSGGKSFRLAEYQYKEFALDQGWDVLQDRLGADLPKALKLNVKEAERIVGNRSDGPKYKASADLWEALEQAGALRKVPRKRMEVSDE